MQKKILIVGGGIAGLTTALALERIQMDYYLLEAVPEIKALGAGITLAGNAMKVLEKLDVAYAVQVRGETLTSMIIQDYRGKEISVVDAEKLNREYGMYNVAIHRGALHEALLEKMDTGKIITGKKAVQYREDEEGVTVYFDDGSSLQGTAVIMADGIHSAIRKQLIPDSQPRYSGYTCWRGVTTDEWNLQGKAFETWGPAGRFGHVPIGQNLVYWFACKNAPYKDEQMKNFTIADLAENFKDYTQPIQSIILQTPRENLIWSDIIDLKPTSRYAFNNLVLIGDAAHATTPNLGQGACMAIEDAWILAEEIQKHPHALSSAFKSFEARRVDRVNFIVNTSYRLGRVAQLENQVMAGLRNFIFRLLPASINDKQMKQVLDIA
jgi:2-polyprenyl-6-methoxyphenol hydroxylase-like FAD-dependent oxidoreductase